MSSEHIRRVKGRHRRCVLATHSTVMFFIFPLIMALTSPAELRARSIISSQNEIAYLLNALLGAKRY